MSDYLKPGVTDTDQKEAQMSFQEWFDNDPDGEVNAVFESSMMELATSEPMMLAVLDVLTNFVLTKPDSHTWRTQTKMFNWWTNNITDEQQNLLEEYYEKSEWS